MSCPLALISSDKAKQTNCCFWETSVAMLPAGVRPCSWAWIVFLTLTSVSFSLQIAAEERALARPLLFPCPECQQISPAYQIIRKLILQVERSTSLSCIGFLPYFLETQSIRLREASGSPLLSISPVFGDFLWSLRQPVTPGSYPCSLPNKKIF